jgi:hypothetical protein
VKVIEMKNKLLLYLIVLSSISYGQSNRITKWYFGYEAGVDFSTGSAIADTDGKLISIEGSSSISDTSGNLLFYSNGVSVWNSNHSIMQNGNWLDGSQSSAQSSLIVPLPNNDSFYYLFTTIIGWIGLRYNIIDMNLDGGFGGVTTSKNISIHENGTEELAATMHCNATDYWIMSRKNVVDSLVFNCYLLDSNGLNSPIVSSFTFPNPWGNSIGSLTFSQDGNTLCLSSFEGNSYVFDFDKQTGQLTHTKTIVHSSNELVYSNALSPDATKLYVTSWSSPESYCSLAQYDLMVPNIASSRVNLDSVFFNGSPNGFGWIGQVRLAPDQKIYVSKWAQDGVVWPNLSRDTLGAIHDPNLLGQACNFERDFLFLNGKPTQLGLPTFVSNFTSPIAPEYNCPVKVDELVIDKLDFEIYPNPFSNETNLRVENPLLDASLHIYNINGKELRRIESITKQEIKIKQGNLSVGLYFFKLIDNSRVVKSGKFIISD